tara:strand:- start:15 stop:236 length:222 start_codon:yes stop_codon:yes gene_type:complete
MEEQILSYNQHLFIIAFIILYNVLVFGYIRGRVSSVIYGILVVSTWITFIGGMVIIVEDYPSLTFWFAKIMSF